MQHSPGGFLDENDVEVGINLEDHVDNEIVFLDILRKNFRLSKIIGRYCSQLNELSSFWFPRV